MAELLKDGYWRCNCEIPCNCSSDESIQKINSPDLNSCSDCGTNKPGYLSREEWKQIRENRKNEKFE